MRRSSSMVMTGGSDSYQVASTW